MNCYASSRTGKGVERAQDHHVEHTIRDKKKKRRRGKVICTAENEVYLRERKTTMTIFSRTHAKHHGASGPIGRKEKRKSQSSIFH